MLSCKRFARHVAGEADPSVEGLQGRVLFWLHWAVCPFCRRYWKEIREMGKIQRAWSSLENHPAVKIGEMKRRLKEKLRKGAA